MQPGINIEDVKRYNASLREYKDKSAKLRAEIEFSQAELQRQCKELTAELGIEVTPENVQDILNERIEKINNTMSVGNEILDRIKAEEVRETSQVQGQVSAQPQAYAQVPQAGAVGVQPPVPPQADPSMGAFTTPASTGIPGMGEGMDFTNLPPIFGNPNNT